MKRWLPLLILLLLPACNDDGNENGFTPSDVSLEVEEFRDDAVELLMRDRVDADEIDIQYILIAVDRMRGDDKPKLKLREAEKKAAEVYKLAQTNADFDRLVLTHTYDRLSPGLRPGAYTVTWDNPGEGRGPSVIARSMLDTNVWKTAWRLEPGEVGAVEKHEEDAETGYYVLRRLTKKQAERDNPQNQPPANERVARMREDAKTFMARDEHDVERVKVQHILIARWMSPMSREGKILEPAEAEKLAGEVYAKVLENPEKFQEFLKEYSFDDLGEQDPPGVFLMVETEDRPDPPANRRSDMVEGFGDLGWRLNVGEIGVLAYDRADSPFGWHIVKRLE